MGNSDIPKALLNYMQEPLITRWWTIGVLACLYTEYKSTYDAIARHVLGMKNAKQKQKRIAKNYVAIIKSAWILSDIYFVSGVCNCWLNKHLNWYQQQDSFMNKAGYLTFHRATRYYIQF